MSPWRIALLLALAVARPAEAAERSDPKALALMAQLRALNGPLDRHAEFHEAGTVIRDGKPGTYEVYGDLHSLRYAATHVLAGIPGGGGFDGRTVWRLGPDGKVTTTTDPKAIAKVKADAYFTLAAVNRPDELPATFRYLGRRTRKGHRLDVVELRPDIGGSAQFWLDVRTHHLTYVTVGAGKDRASVDLWDDRVVDGSVVSFKNYQIEGPHRMTQTLQVYDYVPLDPKHFAPPADAVVKP